MYSNLPFPYYSEPLVTFIPFLFLFTFLLFPLVLCQSGALDLLSEPGWVLQVTGSSLCEHDSALVAQPEAPTGQIRGIHISTHFYPLQKRPPTLNKPTGCILSCNGSLSRCGYTSLVFFQRHRLHSLLQPVLNTDKIPEVFLLLGKLNSKPLFTANKKPHW